MNNLLNVLLKFRENPVGIVGDIKKMYNSVYIKEHVHRFLWRDFMKNRIPNIYVITAVNIGDRPSGTIATVALRETALMAKDTYPKEAEIVLRSTYVDDIVDSVESIEEAQTLTKNITDLLKPGNFHVKRWNISGDRKSLTKDNNIVLGVLWQPSSDTIHFDMRLNFSKKVKKQRIGPDLTKMDIPDKIPSKLTKRIVMSQLNGIYDPLGLLVPFTIKGKILMRDSWARKLDWDTELTSDEANKWINFFTEMLEVTHIKFSRSMRVKKHRF